MARIEDGAFAQDYARLWERHDRNSFFRSPGHLALIAGLTGAELRFAVTRAGEPVAALAFMLKSGAFGPVLNALPFYGTYGGVIGRDDRETRSAIVQAVLDFARDADAAAVTLIDDWRRPSFADVTQPDFRTDRSNQFLDLGRLRGTDPMQAYHPTRRRNVRKAERSGISIEVRDDVRDLEALERLHRENMAAIGGLAKPAAFFEAMTRASSIGAFRLYCARRDGVDMAFLLNFYCGDTVEYYMPTVAAAYRDLQPLSLIIHHAIADAIRDGFAYWNWGGTWASQESLRRFKIRWGSEEASYQYHTFVLNPDVLTATRDALERDYANFFVVPFTALRSGGPDGAAS